nr:IS30 family transposase [Endozoicomonas sp. OPT23]
MTFRSARVIGHEYHQLTSEERFMLSLLRKQDDSVAQIAKKLGRHRSTIYRYIWRDKHAGGNLWTYLRGSHKKRRKRYRSKDSRGWVSGKRHISERPASVETRKQKGHWEIDTVMGKGSNACIVTLIERKTGYTLIGKIPNRTTKSLNLATICLIHRYKPGPFKTIIADNGTEFHRFKELETEANFRFYFATPYHSWERGTNENTNGLIRQYLPKGMVMVSVTQRDCDAIAKEHNYRPRKRLSYKSPISCFHNC